MYNNLQKSIQQEQFIDNTNFMEIQQQGYQCGKENEFGKTIEPYVKIIEQPASKALRFRYECAGRSAGTLLGIYSTTKNKTYPTIEIVGYKGRAKVVVSCVTKNSPHRPHPHNLTGREGCKKGVFTTEINPDTMRASFHNLGIQCVKKKDFESALKSREELRLDPFKTGFAHRFKPSSIDINSVRLCFQVFIESKQSGHFTQPLRPIVSEPIYDKKTLGHLVICHLSNFASNVHGGNEIILLCDKVSKNDIQVQFYEEKCGQIVWEAHGDFQHNDVHKQVAIAFKTPPYKKTDITDPIKVFIRLKRPSDGVTSEPLPFEYIPSKSQEVLMKKKRQNVQCYQNMPNYMECNVTNYNNIQLSERDFIYSNHMNEYYTDKTGTAEDLPATLQEHNIIQCRQLVSSKVYHKNKKVTLDALDEAVQFDSRHESVTIPKTDFYLYSPHIMKNVLNAVSNERGSIGDVILNCNVPQSKTVATRFNDTNGLDMRASTHMISNNNNHYDLESLLNIKSAELVHMNSNEQQQIHLNAEDLQISSLSIYS